MKKFLPIYLVFVFFTWLNSCNSGNNYTGSSEADTSITKSSVVKMKFTPGDNCAGMANIYLEKKEALAMIKHFNKEFHLKAGLPTSLNKHKDSVWIDASVIKAFSDFLYKYSTDYDGLRVLFGASADDSSFIYLIPTTANGNNHTERWGVNVPITTTNHEFRNFNIPENFIKPFTDNFKTKFRKQTNPNDINSTSFDSLSAKVWLNSCIFHLLSDTIETSAKKLDGVMVYFAAYNKIDSSRAGFQKKPNQSTILLVPTNPNGAGKHKPDWDAVRVKIKNMKIAIDPGAYNHGELCPQKCD